MPPYQYVVVRRMTNPGPLACQAIHAATEVLRELPVPKDTHVVLLQAEDGEQLEELATNLSFSGIHHVLIREPAPPFNGAATALAIEPTEDRERVRPFFAGLKVIR